MAGKATATRSTRRGALRRHVARAGLALLVAFAHQGAGAADALRGAQLYAARCGGCHALDENGPGPLHRGVVGRRAASVAGFAYSAALAKSGLTWTATNLDRWLADPNALVPGNRMVVRLAGLAEDRADLIAYLEAESLK